MKKTLIWLILPGIYLFFATGCASFNTAYTGKTAAMETQVQGGNIGGAILEVEKRAQSGGRDGVVFALQAGYYNLFNAQYEKSVRMFALAESYINDYEQRAVLSLRDAGSSAQAALGSDLEMPYKGFGFEKIMLNTLQALNYLMMNQQEKARVEVRRAALRQQEEFQRHQKEVEKIEREREQNEVDRGSVNQAMGHYGFLDAYAGEVINSFQNGFTYFLSGLVYELNNELNEAYIDYKKSFNLGKNRVTLNKLLSLSERLAFAEDREVWLALASELGGPRANDRPTPADEMAEITVFFFDDQVPRLNEQKFSLWTQKQSFNVAWPSYSSAELAVPPRSLRVEVNDNQAYQAELLLDMIPVLARNFKERIPGMVLRQVVRLFAKNLVEKEAENRLGLLGKWGSRLVNTVTERADLRGWYELPRNIQVLNIPVTRGLHRLKLNVIRRDYEDYSCLEELDLLNSRRVLLLVHSLAGRYMVHKVFL